MTDRWTDAELTARLQVLWTDELVRADADYPSIPALDTASAPPAPRFRGGFHVSRPILGVLTVLVAAALTIGAVKVFDSIGGPREGQTIASATVGGVPYTVGIGLGLAVPASAELVPAGTIEPGASPSALGGHEAFALPGIDPSAVLLVRVDKALQAAFPPTGEYLVLYGPTALPSAFCNFYDRASDRLPTICASSSLPVDAAPMTVLTTYLQALQDRNCPGALRVATSDFTANTNAFCAGSVRITGFEINPTPARPNATEEVFGLTLSTQGGDFMMPDGDHTWFYTLTYQSGIGWRVSGGGTGP